MKQVFTDLSTIAHYWANKIQEAARNSSQNFFYSDGIIYSYGRHFPIARHVTNDIGRNAVLFTTQGYSKTTSKHISIVRQACNHLNVIYCHNPSPHAHTENFTSWQHELESIASNLKSARKPEKYLSLIDGFNDQISRYISFFSIPIPASLQAVLAIRNKDQYQSYQTLKEELKKQQEAQAAADLKIKHKKELTKWLKGESHRIYVHDGFDYLRVKDGDIQTTQAVSIPFEIGKRFYNRIKANEVKPGDQITHYTVDAIGETIKIGCHTFKTSYLLKFGKKVFTNE